MNLSSYLAAQRSSRDQIFRLRSAVPLQYIIIISFNRAFKPKDKLETAPSSPPYTRITEDESQRRLDEEIDERCERKTSSFRLKILRGD